jgi:alkylhydroperoxidase family enzyme
VSSEPRLPLLSAAEARQAATQAGVPAALAELNVFRVLLRHPALAKWLADLLVGLLGHGELDPRLRELMIMRIGWMTRSDYEWSQHWRIALRLGLSEQDLLGVREWQRHDSFGPAERSVLALVDEVVRDGKVTDLTWAACREHVADDPRVLLELLTVVGLWQMVAAHLRSLGVPLDDGLASWPPDGCGPAEPPG